MQIKTDIFEKQSLPCVVALGCFDGVHIGHAAVINAAVQKARALGIAACVWTFAEPPRKFYSKDSITLIADKETKENIIRSLEADIFYSVDFNERIADIEATDFFSEVLINTLCAKHIVCGYNFTFGKGGHGDKKLLAKLCEKNGIGFTSLEPIKYNGKTVSSSLIRKYIASGEVELAGELLGRAYSFWADVIDGQHLGRALGFPTINQKIPSSLSVPMHGVYLTRVSFDNESYYGITNIGTRPTVDGINEFSETNIFEYSGNLYGKKVQIEFLKFLRREKKFGSVNELSKQVHKDISLAKELISKQ